MMQYYGAPIPPWQKDAKNLALDNYEQVKMQAVTIYHHVASRSMPITKDPSEYWPDKALELLRTWINQGCRKTTTDSVMTPSSLLEKRETPVYLTRKDIQSLTPEELLTYRTKLTDVLGVMSLNSMWQTLGEMHAWWCLHYQEATFFWHRCFLHYIESLIGFPIPYWNCSAKEAANPDSPYAGIPSVFLEDTYIAKDGQTLKNPLKWAYSYQGKSKSDPNKSNCQRDPILEAGRPKDPGPARDAWDKYIRKFNKYHQQIVKSMHQTVFSLPQYDPAPGYSAEVAWAALPGFTDDMPDSDYTVAVGTFDGLFEQAHDNFHGWVGGKTGEMADNTYTAFDPVFLSYHCNMDRVFEYYLRTHPNTKITASFPLRPFVDKATGYDYTNPNSWAYTSTGEVAKPTSALGYTYGPPASPDVFELAKPSSRTPRASGGVGVSLFNISKDSADSRTKNSLKAADSLKPFILFEDVICTKKSYEIDIFLQGSQGSKHEDNPDLIGSLFRFGMGEPPTGVELKNRSRCMKESVTRIVDAQHHADTIKDRGWFQIVTELDGSAEGRDVPEEEWKQMRGFTGKLVWMAEQ